MFFGDGTVSILTARMRKFFVNLLCSFCVAHAAQIRTPKTQWAGISLWLGRKSRYKVLDGTLSLTLGKALSHRRNKDCLYWQTFYCMLFSAELRWWNCLFWKNKWCIYKLQLFLLLNEIDLKDTLPMYLILITYNT